MFESQSQSEPVLQPYVEIELINGKNLPIRDSNGLSDPFVVFKIKNFKVKSKTIMKNLNPIWNQKLKLQIPVKSILDKESIESLIFF